MTASPSVGAPTGAAGRAASTRGALLAAARDVFIASGFSEASIADVVQRAGGSVGSLYHHFGGKSELYLALFEDYAQRQESRAAEAVREASTAGETDPLRLFLAGGRAYLGGCWTERDLARLFLAGGGPPGFEVVRRRRHRAWTRRNASLLSTPEDGGEPWGDALVLVLTTVMSEAGAEVAVCEDEASAHRLAHDVLALIGRIAGGGQG